MGRTFRLEDYYVFLEPGTRAALQNCRERLQGASIQHVNSTAIGGGVAELLSSLAPLMRAAGLACAWSVMQAEEEFFRATKTFHNALHGQKLDFTPALVHAYQKGIQANLELVDPDVDFVVIHDLQPLGLVARRAESRARWIWYCHVDPTQADRRVWRFLREYVDQFDLAIFHLPEYLRPDLHVTQHTMAPGIDPLSQKNQELTPIEQEEILTRLGVDVDRPVVLQVSRFDRLKDPLGVIDAFRAARYGIPAQLVLAGGSAADDPEAAQVLAEVQEAAGGDPDIKVFSLNPDSDLEINALQRTAAVVVQKSLREGFGLTVTEALWKARPVVGSAVGGIRHQIKHGRTGLLVHSIAETATAIRGLLRDPVLGRRLGEAGKEHVRKKFLLPVYLLNWLKLLRALKEKEGNSSHRIGKQRMGKLKEWKA
ncbi:MAG: glycosyltransferase [Bacillota bacterium]|nr:glycosyltransferase [Bacillota bacterium]